MTDFPDTPGIAIQVSRNVVIASIQVDLEVNTLARFREDLLQRLHTSGSQAVILDVSGLETLDSVEFAGLRKLIKMIEIMGADAVVVGLRPGVVSSLIETGADIDGLKAAINLDAAYEMLEQQPESGDPLEIDALDTDTLNESGTTALPALDAIQEVEENP